MMQRTESGAAPTPTPTMFGGTARHTARDLFPLTAPPPEPPAATHLCRGTRQRIQKRRAIETRVREAFGSMNELAGAWGPSTLAESAQQNATYDFIRSAVQDLPADPFCGNVEEARQALLGRSSAYSGHQSRLRPLCVPMTGAWSVFLLWVSKRCPSSRYCP